MRDKVVAKKRLALIFSLNIINFTPTEIDNLKIKFINCSNYKFSTSNLLCIKEKLIKNVIIVFIKQDIIIV